MMPRFYTSRSYEQITEDLGYERIKQALYSMLLIREFEKRGEAAYQQGFIGGFYHAYAGQEAIAVAAIEACGKDNWYATTYRCHALALLLGVSPKEAMAELFGRATGNVAGRGGSMHLYSDRLLGGFGIVGGHLPIAAGAAFSLKYLQQKGASICFLGEGAVAQGAFHETLNLAALWNLPVIYVVENNQWGMGTHVSRAICTDQIAAKQAPSYCLESYTLNGMDFFNCYDGFLEAYQKVQTTQKPILIECICERFRGHSISDPGLYRSKEQLQQVLSQDPIDLVASALHLSEEVFSDLAKQAKEQVVEAINYAKESPWPSVASLEKGVYAD